MNTYRITFSFSTTVETDGDEHDAEEIGWSQFQDTLSDGLHTDDFGAVVDFFSSDEDEGETA